MTDNRVIRGRKDLSRIDVNDPVDVEYIHHQFPWLSRQQILQAIKKHGPDREAVLAFLERAGSSKEV